MTPAEKVAAKKKPRKSKHSQPKRKRVWVCKVREARQALRLSMRDVSANVGISVTAICDIERGTDPQLSTARKLAEFFGNPIDELWPERSDRNGRDQ